MTKYHFHCESGIDATEFAVTAMGVGFSVAIECDGAEWETVTLTDTDRSADLYWANIASGAVPVGGGGEWEITAEKIAKIS